MKVDPLCTARELFSLESHLHFIKSTILPGIGHFYHIWSRDPDIYGEILYKTLEKICNATGSKLPTRLQSFSHRHDVASNCLFYFMANDLISSTPLYLDRMKQGIILVR